jgi:5-methylcytosine-specific restriction protein A
MIIMPYKAKKPCAHPGCPALTDKRYCSGTLCRAYATQAHRDYNQHHRRPGSNKTYGRRWHTIRDLYINAHPLCEDCLTAGRCIRAEEVHHVIPVDRGGTHAEENLRALCRSCHATVTAANRK